MILAEIKKLNLAERIQLVEDIWDSIAIDAEPLPLSPEEQEILDERLAELNASSQSGSTWKEAKKRIESRL